MESQNSEISKELLEQSLRVNITDNEQRKMNEEMIKKFKLMPKYSCYLLDIATNCKDPEVQLNAAIQLKNYINENWKFTNNHENNKNFLFDEDDQIIIIDESDKSYIRENLIKSIVYIINQENQKVLKQLNQSIKKVIKWDYPGLLKESYDEIILKCLSNLSNQKEVYAGINIMHQISKVFEFEDKEKKECYYDLAEKANNYLIKIITDCNNINNNIQALFIYKILRIFFRSFQGALSKFLTTENVYNVWSEIILTVIKNPISEENALLKNDKDNIYRKLKKVCFQIITRVYKKYSEQTYEKECKEFKKSLLQNYSKIYYDVYKQIFINCDKYKYYIDDVCLNLIYQLFICLMDHKKFSEDIENLFLSNDNLKLQLIKDAMMTKEDLDQWINEPKSYIDKQGDDISFCFSKKYNTYKMLNALLSYRTKENKKLNKESKKNKNISSPPPTYYTQFCNYYINCIQQIQSKQIEENNNLKNCQFPTYQMLENNLIKESLMFLIQMNSDIIEKYSPDSIELLIEKYILPEFDSPFGIMREKACVFVTKFHKHVYKNPQIVIEITKKICLIINNDKCLPVKIKGVVAASSMLSYSNAKLLLKDHIATLLEIYLKLMEQTDKEEIMDSLQQIINEFKNESRDYIIKLSDYLIKYFMKITAKSEEEEADTDKYFDNSSMISNIINTFVDIIRYFKNDMEIYTQIEDKIKKLINYCFNDENLVDRIEDGLDLLGELVRYSNTLSPNIWEFYPKIISSVIGTEEEYDDFKKKYPNENFEGCGLENLDDISKIINGFIIQDPIKFISLKDSNGKQFIFSACLLVERVVTICESSNSYTDIKYAFDILKMILNTYRGKVDEILIKIIEIINTKLSTKNKHYKEELRSLFSVCMIYNSDKTLQYLNSINQTENIIKFWLEKIDEIEGLKEIKFYIMGLTSLISMNPQNQSSLVLNEINNIINKILKLIEKYIEIEEKIDNESEEEEYEEISDDEDDDNNKDDDKNKNKDKDDDIEDDEEIDEEWDDEEDYFKIYGNKVNEIERKNPVLFFRDMLQYLSKSDNQNYYNSIINAIGMNKINDLKNLFEKEEKNEKEKISNINDNNNETSK